MLAPLLFSFLRNSALSPALETDAASNTDNPIYYFVGFVVAGFALALLLLGSRKVRRAVQKAPVAAWLLLLLASAAVTCVHLAVSAGSRLLLPIGGTVLGVASVALFVLWCQAYARLQRGVAIRTACVSCVLAYLLDLAFSFTSAGSVASVVITFGAAFLSAVPLENLRRAGSDTDEPGDANAPDGVSTAVPTTGALVASGWPVLLAALIAYMAMGFSWGNALFGMFEYFDATNPCILALAKCVGAVVTFACVGMGARHLDDERLAEIAVALLLVAWLVTGATGLAGAWAVTLLTGIAYGLVDTLLLAWACTQTARGDMRAATPASASALCVCAVSIPFIVGIILAPVLRGSAATLVTPVCSVVYFIALLALARPQGDIVPAEVGTMATPQAPDAFLRELAEQAGLSARETDVFLALAQGHSSSYIADELGLSAHTVKTHVKHIYTKMDVHSKDEFLSAVQPTRTQ